MGGQGAVKNMHQEAAVGPPEFLLATAIPPSEKVINFSEFSKLAACLIEPVLKKECFVAVCVRIGECPY